MQTFVPYPHVIQSLEVLDDKRLGKQRVEAYQILLAIYNLGPVYDDSGRNTIGFKPRESRWSNHPAVRMWRDFDCGLTAYALASCKIWTEREFRDSLHSTISRLHAEVHGDDHRCNPMSRDIYPDWWGNEDLHRSHRSNLLRKFPEHYAPIFEDDLPDNLEYVWPTP